MNRMKTFFIKALFIFVALNFSQAMSTETEYITKKKWHKVAISKDGELTSYVNRKSVKRNGDRVTYIQLNSLEKGIERESGETVYSVIETTEVNCTNNEARFLKSVFYQGKMGKGKIIQRDNSITEWEYFEKSSVMGIVLNYVCTKMKVKNLKPDIAKEDILPDTSESVKESEDDWF